METLLFRLAAGWTVVGLLGGLGYRELTRSHDFDGRTQLAVVHTHALVLGALMMLLLLVMERVFTLSTQKGFRAGLWIYTAGVAITTVMLAVNGVRTVLGHEGNPALAGISGTGHMTITAGLVMLFLALGRAVGADRSTGSDPE